METHLQISGILLILVSLGHAVFPKYFKWKQELASLSVINRQLMYVHSFFIALIVGLIGILCLTSADDLQYTEFGRRISLGLAVFWAIRLFIQFFVYSSATWKGKTFETVIHILISIFWVYLSCVFILVYQS